MIRTTRLFRRLAQLLLLLGATALASPAAAASRFAPWLQPSYQGSAPTDAPSGEGADPGGIEGLNNRVQALGARLMDDPVAVLQDWLLRDGPALLGKLLLFLVILAVSKVIASALASLVRGALAKSRVNASELFKNFVENTVSKVVLILGLIVALQTIGVNVAPLLAGIGVLGFVIGFALQDTLGNFAAGVMLLLYRPYDIGNFVNVAGQDGTVEAMTLVSTTLLTLDNQRLTIPNGSIWGTVIRNVTANPTRKINETIGIGYGDDIERAETIMLEVVAGLEHVQKEPEPQVFLTGLADSSVNFAVRAWVPTSEYFGTCCELRRQMKLRFDREGISIPFPQRDVHLHQ